MKKTFILIFSLLSATPITIDADEYGLSYQTLLPDFQQLTPEAAALGSHGNIDASEYTGQPNIQIPLYTVSVGDISVPIYLSYDASGIKVDQQASFVGLGWNLIYGGCINRIICGQEDNKTGSTTYDYFKNHFGEFLKSANNLEVITVGSSVSSSQEQATMNLMDAVAKECFMPDVYQASFCGHSVTFTCYHGDTTIIGDDATKYKINTDGTKIHITDDKGIVYSFLGFRENQGEAYSYYLQTITSLNGDQIQIEYEQDGREIVSPLSLFETQGRPFSGILIPTIENQFVNKQTTLTCTSLFKVYPKSIKSSKEEVRFDFVGGRADIPAANKLNGIKVISNNGGKTIRTISFDYGYFTEERRGEKLSMEVWGHSLNSDYCPKRLQLKSVKIGEEVYSFEYNTSVPLPYNTSLAQDYWGYYNGVNNCKDFSVSPKFRITPEGMIQEDPKPIGDGDRYCSPAHIQAGMLTRIKYPTGGYTQFEYEVNKFSDSYRYCYPTSQAFTYSSPSNTRPVQTAQLGVVSLTPGHPATNGSYNEQIVDFVITGEEPETECVEVKQYAVYADGQSKNEVIRVGDAPIGASIKTFLRVNLFIKGQTKNNSQTSAPHYQTVYLRFWGHGEDGSSYDSQYTVAHESQNFEQTIPLQLTKGTYHMSVRVEHKNNDYTSAIGYMKASYPKITPFSPSFIGIDLKDTDGGPSYGAGLRIRQIDNYDQDSHYLGGKRYKYKGGKLQIPTAVAEAKCIETYYQWDPHEGHSFGHSIFNFISSQTTYPTICTLGVPTIGYSEVEKDELDKDGNVVRRTISNYYNNDYSYGGLVNFYGSTSHKFFTHDEMNGKILMQTVKSGDGQLMSTTRYSYGRKQYSSVLYAGAVAHFVQSPLHKYGLFTFPKANVWIYPTKTEETTYVDGVPMTPVVTTFNYKEDNYKQNLVTKTVGSQRLKYELFYPMDKKSEGYQDLLDKHILGECTMSKQYLNDRFLGGTKFNYTKHNEIPVISTSYQILPNQPEIKEMEVTDYDDYGNIREYKTKDGIYTTIIWSYNHLYPVLQVVGTQYKDIKGYVTSLESAKTLSRTTLVTAHSNISRVGGIVTAYLYDAWYGVSDIIAPNGKITHYDRDSQGRLSAIRENDSNGPVIQSFFYKYLTQ